MTGTGRKKKILYLMHIDWNWIKQRPHFLAEGLSSLYDVLVLYHYSSDRSVLVDNSTTIKNYPIPRVPFGRFSPVEKTNVFFQKIFFNFLLKIYNPDIVWITFPSLYNYVAECDLRNRTLVYDCMDDAVEFLSDDNYRRSIHNVEQTVLERADIVFASSQNLLSKLTERGCISSKISLIRNAFDNKVPINFPGDVSKEEPALESSYRLCYVGTVADYIDFEVILFCLHNLPSIEFHFIGPIVCNVPAHENMFFHGPVQHVELSRIVSEYDGFLLPFKVNELVLGVDPVKLYEYVNFNKNIISIYYDEIKRFKDFVNFYENKEDFVDVVRRVSKMKGAKYSLDARQDFLTQNSWAVRVSTIAKLLEIDYS